MKTSGCGKLAIHPLTGSWFRAISLKHWKTRLSTDHTRFNHSRFGRVPRDAPLHRILYLGENHQVAIYEVGALLGDPSTPLSDPKGSWVLMSLRVRLHGVADLPDPDQQKPIATNNQELTGVWAREPVATPTQQLGAALYKIPGLEGFLHPSSKGRSRNFALFMDKLGPRSTVTFENELDSVSERLT